MTKNFFCLMGVVMVSMLCVCFASCSSDNADDGLSGNELVTEVIGTWMCTDSEDSFMGYLVKGEMVGKEVTINRNGTYTSTAPSFGYSGTYTVKGNSVTAKSSDGNTFMITVSVHGDRMTWNGTASVGTTFNYTFVREI